MSGKRPRETQNGNLQCERTERKDDDGMTNKMAGKLLRWAYKNSLDVLFIQEHNGDRAKVIEWKTLCERSG